MSVGGSSSRSSSESQSFGMNLGENYSQTYLNPQQQMNQQALVNAFMPQLGQMNPAVGQYAGIDPSRALRPGMAGNAANMRQAGNAGIWAQAMQTGYNRQAYRDQLGQSRAAMDQLGQFAQQSNPFIEQQISNFGSDISRNLSDNILPALGSQAQMGGQRGGSRQSIAEGMAAQEAQRQFSQGSTNMRSQAYGQQQQAAQAMAAMQGQMAMNLGGLTQQGAQNLTQNALQAVFQQGSLANEGLSTYFGNQANIMNAGVNAQLMPFQIGAQVVGAPSVLSQSYGYDFGVNASKSKSKGKGASAEVGFS